MIRLILSAGLFSAILLAVGCAPNQKILESANSPTVNSNSANAQAPAEKPASSVAHDIQSMRDADFNFIFLFRRKDGAVMDADDKKFFNSFTPPQTNRRVLSDDGRAIIVGSNFRWEPEIFRIFTERFNLEDYSKPENEIINTNGNSRTEK